MRLFIAVEIPQTVRDALARLQSALSQLIPSEVRWSKAATIHLTLRFLGEASEAQVAALQERLAPGAPFSPFRFSPGSLGMFSSRGRPRVLFVDLRGTQPLEALAAWVDGKAEAAGFVREARPFSPHLTLARFTAAARRAPILPELPAPLAREEILVDRFSLFRSHLGPQGARHECLSSYPLLGEARS
jgi:2'-5' RNA ligase